MPGDVTRLDGLRFWTWYYPHSRINDKEAWEKTVTVKMAKGGHCTIVTRGDADRDENAGKPGTAGEILIRQVVDMLSH